MSGEALKWALDQNAADTGAQYLLVLLALRSDETGRMTPINVHYLAKKIRQSRRNVFRILTQLEAAGVFQREACRGSNGLSALAGRLMLDRELNELSTAERNAMRKTQAGETDDDEDISSELAKGAGVGDSTSPTPWVTQSHPLGDVESQLGDTESPSTLYEENLLITTKANMASVEGDKGVVVEEDDQEFQKRLNLDFYEFKKGYPFDATMSLPAARESFGELSIKDREKATRYASRYAQALRDKKRKFAMDAVNWIKRREFEALAGDDQDKAVEQGLAHPKVFVRKGTPAFEAWDRNWRATRGVGAPDYAKHENQTGWWFETLFPPESQPDPSG